MLDGVSLDLIKDLTGWSLAGLLFLLMATGRLVPLRTVRREQEMLEREASGWKAAHDTESAQLDAILIEVRKLLPQGVPTSPAAPPVPPAPARREVTGRVSPWED
jgi:hypothetical protein